MQDLGGYSYFRKPVSESGEADEIFCDDESRVQMMERVVKGRMVPLLILFSFVVVPQFILQILSQRYIGVALFAGILVLYLYCFTYSFIKYREYRKKVKK